MKYLSLVLFILVGCGANPNSQPVVVDPTLQPYFMGFETTIGYTTYGVSGAFANTETESNPLGETIGECVIWSNGVKQIKIDTNYWATADESERTQVVFHELGHCSLMLQHINTLLSNGCPTSIMYPYTFGDSHCYVDNLSYYFNELSSHKP